MKWARKREENFNTSECVCTSVACPWLNSSKRRMDIVTKRRRNKSLYK